MILQNFVAERTLPKQFQSRLSTKGETRQYNYVIVIPWLQGFIVENHPELYSEPFVDDDKLAGLSKGVVPARTDECARWALTNFAAWMNFNSKPRVKASRRPNDHAMLNTHISWFVLETRTKVELTFIP